MIDPAQIPPVAPSFPMHGTRLVPSLTTTPGPQRAAPAGHTP